MMQDYYTGLGAAHLRLIYVDMLVLEPGVSSILTCLATPRHAAASTHAIASALVIAPTFRTQRVTWLAYMHRMKAYWLRTKSTQLKRSEPRH